MYPFLPAISRGLGIDVGQAGALVSTRWGASLVAPAALGAMRASIPARRMLVTGMLAFALGAALTALTGVIAGAVIGFIVMGLAKPVIDIAGQHHVADRTPFSIRARYIGILETSWAGGLLIGGPIAGWLIDRGDWRTPFLVFASVAVLSTGLALIAIPPSGSVRPPDPSRAPGRIGRVVRFLAAIVLIGFAHESLLVVLGEWLESDFGMTLLALGGVGTLLGVSDLAGEGLMIGLTDRIGKRRAMVIGSVIAIGGFGVVGYVEAIAPALVGLSIGMIGTEWAYISGIPLATEFRPDDRTRVLGWFYVSTGTGRIAGDLIAPGLFSAGGISTVTTAASIAFVIAIALVGVTAGRAEDV